MKPWSNYMEVHWGKGIQAYVTAVSGEEICVTVISRQPGGRLETILREFPSLSNSLEGAEATSTERGAVTAMHRLAGVCRGNVALIGDASGGVDAITGEGLGLGFQQAAVLAEALANDDLEQYQAAHRRLARRPHWMARLMLLLGEQPILRERTLRVLRTEPRLFERLLAVHVGESSPLHLATTGMLLGWRLLAA